MWQTGDPVQMDEIALPQFDIRQEDIDYGNCTKYYAGTGTAISDRWSKTNHLKCMIYCSLNDFKHFHSVQVFLCLSFQKRKTKCAGFLMRPILVLWCYKYVKSSHICFYWLSLIVLWVPWLLVSFGVRPLYNQGSSLDKSGKKSMDLKWWMFNSEQIRANILIWLTLSDYLPG